MTPVICDRVTPQLLTRKWEHSGLWADSVPFPFKLLAKGNFQFYCYLWVSKSSSAHMCILSNWAVKKSGCTVILFDTHLINPWLFPLHLLTLAYLHNTGKWTNEQHDEQKNSTAKQKTKPSTNHKWKKFLVKKNHYKTNYSCSNIDLLSHLKHWRQREVI